MNRVVAVGIAVMLFGVAAGDQGISAMLRTRERARTLASDISALRAENARLRARAEALRSDPSTIETEARRTLGLARPDEIVVTRRR